MIFVEPHVDPHSKMGTTGWAAALVRSEYLYILGMHENGGVCIYKLLVILTGFQQLLKTAYKTKETFVGHNWVPVGNKHKLQVVKQ